MTDPRTFLDSIAQYTRDQESTSSSRTPKMGTIDPAYTTGKPKVLFDGDSTISPEGFTFVNTYKPVANDRVMLNPTGNTYVIMGKPGGSTTADDHGLLTGLADNDHPQYSLTSHNHDPAVLTGTQRHYARYQSTVNQAITSAGSNKQLYFQTDQEITPSITKSDTGTGNRFTVNTAGIWAITATVRFVPGGVAGERFACISHDSYDGATQVAVNAHGGYSNGAAHTMSLAWTGHMRLITWVHIEAYQASGATLNTESSWTNVQFSLIRQSS